MSAAALRYVARRTVGVGGRALQRTRAAVEEQQRRTLIHSGAAPLSFPRVSSPFTTTSCSTAKGENEALKEATAWQVKKMKEDLYTAMTSQERHNSEYAHFRVLEYLSGQIDPRRSDPLWRKYRRGEGISECLKYAGIYFIASKVLGSIVGY